MIRIGFVTTVLLSASLTGCLVGPDYHSPRVLKVKQYTENRVPSHIGKQSLVSTENISKEWWVLFHSYPLNELIHRGIANSPNLLAAQATLLQAQENYNAQFGASLFPSVSAQLSGERQRFSNSSLGVSGNSLFNLYNASVTVSYTLDMFGGARRELESLQAQVDYERFQLQAAYLTLTSNIVATAITAASYQEQIQATHELIKAQADQLNIVNRQFDLGGASGADVLSQKSQLAQTRATLPPLEKSLAQARHALSVLVGAFPSESHLPKLELKKLYLPRRLPVSVLSSLARRRPDIQAAEALVHAASAQVGVATANLYPQITLSGAYGWEGASTSRLINPVNNVWNWGGQLIQPIFNAGSLQAKKRAAIAGLEQAAAQYRETVLQAFQNVADTLRALEEDAKTLRAQQEAETAAYGSLKITKMQYRLGGVSYLSLLTAQKQYQQTRIARIQAQAARFTDTAALFQALGGGWVNQ